MYDASEVLAEFLEKGVSFRADKERLLYFAPKGVITPEGLAVLKDCKDEILRKLQSLQQTNSTCGTCTFFPLTFQQTMLWEEVHRHNNWNKFMYSFALSISGALKVTELQAHLRLMVNRHGSLRTQIVTFGRSQMQRVEDADADFCFEVISFDDAPAIEVVQKARAFIEHYVDGITTPAASNLFETRILKLSDCFHILTIIIHHIVSDAYSLHLFFCELWSFLNETRADLTHPHRHLPSEYAEYAAWQRNTSVAWRAEHEPYWRQRLADVSNVRIKRSTQISTEEGEGELNWVIAEPVAARIRGAAKCARTLPSLIMLSVFTAAVSRWSETSDFILLVNVSGRHLPEHTAMIGLLAYYQFLRITLESRDCAKEVLAKVSQELYSGLDHQDYARGVTHASLDRMRNPSFNWIQASPEMSGLASMPLRDPSGSAITAEAFPFSRHITGSDVEQASSVSVVGSGPTLIVDDTGHHFNVTLYYRGYARAMMEEFSAQLLALCEEFVGQLIR
jgi:Condensation domain/TubC N-terminal docking domain